MSSQGAIGCFFRHGASFLALLCNSLCVLAPPQNLDASHSLEARERCCKLCHSPEGKYKPVTQRTISWLLPVKKEGDLCLSMAGV